MKRIKITNIFIYVIYIDYTLCLKKRDPDVIDCNFDKD